MPLFSGLAAVVCGGGRGPARNCMESYLKARYYYEKLGITPAHADVHFAIKKHYLEGLLWCLAYYYRGCVSW